jgi:hypothetical protein
MIAAARSTYYEDHAWMIGDDDPDPYLSDRDRQLGSTRIAALIFKRRARLLFHWRGEAHRQATKKALQRSLVGVIRLSTTRHATSDGAIALVTNLPRHFAPLREEITIWRSFLGTEIHAILFGTE